MPLLRRSRRGHATRTHLSQSRRASEPLPAAYPAISRALKRLGIRCQTESGEPFPAYRNLRVES